MDPWFSVQPPNWIRRHLRLIEYAFAVRNFGDEVRPLSGNESPFGANMGFRTEVLKSYTFNPKLGRMGADLISGDETDVINRMKQAGHQGIWVGMAKVQHFIPPERMNVRFIAFRE